MAVVDILRKYNREEADVCTCGLKIALIDGHSGKTKSGAIIGRPEEKFGRKDWNAHLVVRFGDFLFDPTLIQVRRDWNHLPHIGAFLCSAPEGHVTPVVGNIDAPTLAIATAPLNHDHLQFSFFYLPQVDGFENSLLPLVIGLGGKATPGRSRKGS